MRDRVADKRVLALIKAFLRAGILTEHSGFEELVQRLCLNGTGVAVVVGPPGTGKNIPTASVTER